MKKLIIFIIIYLIFKEIVKESYEEKKNLNNLFLVINDRIRVDLTKPRIHNLSKSRSKFLFNYLFNLKHLNLIKNNSSLNENTLGNYIEQVCFISDYNLSESIIFIINNFILNFLKSDRRVGLLTPIDEYYSLLINLYKLNFKNNFIKNIDYKGSLNTNSIIINLLIDKLFNISSSDKTIMNEIIDMLVDKKWIILETNQDYDDLDLFFETLNLTYKNYINNNFNLNYDYLLNFSISEIQNLYYNGDIFDFVLNLDLYCK